MKLKVRQIVYWIVLVVFQLAVQLEICSAQTFATGDSTKQVTQIRIDPVSATEGQDVMLFDSIKYISLKTNRQSEFSTISQLEVTDYYFVILDENLKSIFFFKKDGSFSHKINKDSQGIPFKSITRFSIEESQNILSFNGHLSPYIYTFGLDGNFLNRVKDTIPVKDFALFNGFKIFYHRFKYDSKDDTSHFASIVRVDAATDQNLGSYLPVDSVRKNTGLLESKKHFYQSGSKNLLFTQPYDYTIYEFDTTAVPHKRHQVILPHSNTLPVDFLTNPIYHGKWKNYLASDRSIVYSIQAVYLSGNWLSFYMFPSIKGSAFLYNLTTNDLFNLRETKDSSLGLPITERLSPILGVENGALISELSFLSLKQLYEKTPKSKRDRLLPQNLKVLMNQKSHNPILRLSYLKQNYTTQ